MKSIRFIHCADIHLDTPFVSLKKKESAAIRRKDIKDTFSSIIDTVKESKADFLLISGDLYEHSYSSRATAFFLNERFSYLEDVPVVIVPGNHDPYIVNSFYRTFSWKSNVHILHPENPVVNIPHLNTYLYGIGFENFKQDKPALEVIQRIQDDNSFHILLFHGTVDMNFGKNPYNQVESEFLTGMGMDYYALGHFHSRKEDYGAEGFYNPGSPEPLGFDEPGRHGVYSVELFKEEDVVKRQVSFIDTANREYHNLAVDVSGCSSLKEIKIMILKSLEGFSREKDIFKLELKGLIDPDFNIELKELEDFFQEEYFYVEIRLKTRPDYNLEGLKHEAGLRGLFTAKMLERIKNTRYADEKEKLRRALYLGLEAIDKGRIESGPNTL